jgi:S1-C subfamily serine protease
MQNRDDLFRLAGKLGGLPVLGCRPHSPAASAGIRYGDILLRVNGMPTPDWTAYLTARALDDTYMVVEMFRGGEHVTHKLRLDRLENVDPLALLEELIDQRVLAPQPAAAEPEPS